MIILVRFKIRFLQKYELTNTFPGVHQLALALEESTAIPSAARDLTYGYQADLRSLASLGMTNLDALALE